MTRTIIFIIIFIFPTSTKLFCQEISEKQTFIAKRIGYFNATLTISKDSTYQYNESNHQGQKLKDSGKLIFKNDNYYLNSESKTTRTSTKDKSEPFYRFNMQKIDYGADKIVIIPCDSILPEYCTFINVKDYSTSEIAELKVQEEWKKILATQNFKVTKNKYKIPLAVLKQIDVDTISEITRNVFRWDASCMGREPSVKLNWAATDKKNWIICYTIGGYSVKTYYQFISPDTTLNTDVSHSVRGHYNFKNFKNNYTTDKMKKKTIKAKY